MKLFRCSSLFLNFSSCPVANLANFRKRGIALASFVNRRSYLGNSYFQNLVGDVQHKCWGDEIKLTVERTTNADWIIHLNSFRD